MQVLAGLRTLVMWLAACACAAHLGCAAQADGKARRGGLTASAPRVAAPTPGDKMDDEINRALQRNDVEGAAAIVARGRRAPPADRPSAKALAYYEATVLSFKGDYRGAAKVLYDHLATVGPATADAFYFHDAMIALRTANGDLIGALVECEEMVKAGVRGTWMPSDIDRLTLVRLKEHWHRAYLLRMIAQTLAGAERQVFVAYAESARKEYVELATPLGTMGDSIAVLDAYFAFCDGQRDKMREAALRVNVAENDDIEDLYLVQLALDAAGDRDAAAAVRKRMQSLPPATVLTHVFLAWMRADDEAGQRPRFSPKYPTEVRPLR